ncbi:MAG: PepSY-associated TM helix domain-containing protein [Cyclobacteriaceae bacterium]
MSKLNKKSKAWPKTRKFFNDIHLWSGLISGLVLLVVCFTGTIYVYHAEIREMGAPHLYHVSTDQAKQRLPLDELVKKVYSETSGDITSISIPHKTNETIQLAIKVPGEKSRFGTTYFINPYNAEVLGTSNDPNKAAEWLKTLFSLHRWLLLDKIEKPLFGELPNRQLGSYITGTATILFTLGVLTGLVIWFPRQIKSWRQGLKIKTKASWKRINHDLHNTLAFYSIIILFLMGITGPFWSFPWYREGLQKSLGTYRERQMPPVDRRSGTENKDKTKPENPDPIELLSFQQYLEVADRHLTYPGNYRISLPQEGSKTLSIAKSKVGFFAPAASDKITLNALSLEVESLEIFKKKPLNERISASIKALHMGDVYGSFSKFLYFISCLIATSLPITGTLIWINKMKKTSKKTPKTVARKSDTRQLVGYETIKD